MLTKTYYEVLDREGKPSLAQRRVRGTSLYGYHSIARARASARRSGMPEDSQICERHCDSSGDWAGRVVGLVNGETFP